MCVLGVVHTHTLSIRFISFLQIWRHLALPPRTKVPIAQGSRTIILPVITLMSVSTTMCYSTVSSRVYQISLLLVILHLDVYLEWKLISLTEARSFLGPKVSWAGVWWVVFVCLEPGGGYLHTGAHILPSSRPQSAPAPSLRRVAAQDVFAGV